MWTVIGATHGDPPTRQRSDPPEEWAEARPMVREGGVEPPRPFGHWNLNPARLPIPPLAQ